MMRKLTLMLTLTALVALIAAPAVSAAPPTRGIDLTGAATGTDVDTGAPWAGTVTVEGIRAVGDQLVADVSIADATGAPALTGTTAVPLQLSQGCDILTLDIGAIFLDLLGLQVDIAPISIDITAVPGPGNLLGNLLCAVAGLLDGPSPLANLINRLLGILNGLLA
jgi:hypothetical protein